MEDVEMAEVEVTDVDLDATIGPQSSSESKEDTDSDAQFDPANIDVKQLRKATNKLLTLLGVAEIDKSKMRGQAYQIDKMKKLTNRLASALFPHAQPANDAEQMIHQLKEKFHDTNSRNMKTKILSVLPKDWTDSYRSTKELLRRVRSLIQLNRKNSNCSKTKIFHVH